MTATAPVHAFLRPRLAALVDDAVAHGVAREVAVAVLIDIVTSPPFDTAIPDPKQDAPTQPAWDRDASSVVLVGGVSPLPPPDPTAQGEDDFIKPTPWMGPS